MENTDNQFQDFDETRNLGFKSRLGHSESRSGSGFPSLKNYLGQQTGQTKIAGPNNLKEAMASKRDPNPYRLAKVYQGPKESFVEYYYWDLEKGRYVRDKIRLGLRKLTDKERRNQLQELCVELNKVLRERNRRGEYHVIHEPNEVVYQRLSMCGGLEIVRSSMDEDISEDRRKAIREAENAYASFLKAHPVFSATVIEKTPDEAFKWFRKWCKQEGRAGKTINKYLGAIQFASEWLKRNKYIPNELSTKHLRVAAPKNESGRFPPLSDDEKKRVFSYWRAKDPYFHHFLFWAYYTAIRGSEAYRIQRKDINFENRTIFCSFFKTKNGLSNYVQILQPLYDLMLELEIDKLPPDHYIFGVGFKPTTKRYNNEQASERWADHRERMGLDKSKQLYGLKHTFNVDYVEQNKGNIDWEWLRRHNRHATVQQTQQYISGLTAYFLDEKQSVIQNYYSK